MPDATSETWKLRPLARMLVAAAFSLLLNAAQVTDAGHGPGGAPPRKALSEPSPISQENTWSTTSIERSARGDA